MTDYIDGVGTDHEESPMSSVLDNHVRVVTNTVHDPFELDIAFIEQAAMAAALLNVTDDGCGSTCPQACGTSFEG